MWDCLLPVFLLLTLGSGRPAAAQRAGDLRADTSFATADKALRTAMADSASWPSYGRGYTNRRFAPLAQISTGNVGSLRLAWSYRTGVSHAFQTSPVVVDGAMYISTPLNQLIALDARTAQSVGMSKAFVNTLRRDYLARADRGSAAVILDHLAGRIAGYNGIAPHSARG